MKKNKFDYSQYKLISKSMFREYKKGDKITDPKEIENILNCHEKSMVIKVLLSASENK